MGGPITPVPLTPVARPPLIRPIGAAIAKRYGLKTEVFGTPPPPAQVERYKKMTETEKRAYDNQHSDLLQKNEAKGLVGFFPDEALQMVWVIGSRRLESASKTFNEYR